MKLLRSDSRDRIGQWPFTILTIEQAILLAVADLEQQAGKAITLAIAMRVMLSEPQTRRYLVSMEQRGLVKRIGNRGGWQCVEPSA